MLCTVNTSSGVLVWTTSAVFRGDDVVGVGGCLVNVVQYGDGGAFVFAVSFRRICMSERA